MHHKFDTRRHSHRGTTTAVGMSAEQRSTYPLCGAKTRSGGTCRMHAGSGTNHKGVGRCKLHGGSTPTHVASAIAYEARRRAIEFGEELPVEPGDALLTMLRLSAGMVAWTRDELARMDDRRTFEAQVLTRMYADERDRTARIAKAALDAGVAERMVRLAESYGELLATLIGNILKDIRLTAEQSERAPEIVRRRLLELDPGEPAEAA
ncbi:MAG TPA: hypothetical protein VFJ77_03825 [Gaiellaceae bacterium]|nr:hypothetical protein [Gaiellaceae bacterium]